MTTPLSPAETIRDFAEAWAAGDIGRTMGFVADDCIYMLYLSNEVVPFGGETRGKDNVEAALRLIRSKFEYLLYRAHNIVAQGNFVRCRVEFMYRHIASGEVLSGRFRLVFELRDGLIWRADEYHDSAMIETFLKLVAET
jgi:ketosteroid isomerase-like protein